jgi:hypothetical protein
MVMMMGAENDQLTHLTQFFSESWQNVKKTLCGHCFWSVRHQPAYLLGYAYGRSTSVSEVGLRHCCELSIPFPPPPPPPPLRIQ